MIVVDKSIFYLRGAIDLNPQVDLLRGLDDEHWACF